MEEPSFFKHKKANRVRLLAFGFTEQGGVYGYATDILGGQFRLTVVVSDHGVVNTRLIEAASREEYALHRVAGAHGAFVGTVKEAYKNVLQGIADSCFEPDVFKGDVAKQVVRYFSEHYGDELEFLWARSPESAIVRRKDNRKWYAALLGLPKSKLGLAGNERIEVLNLRISPQLIDSVVDRKRYFPGYHMNKKHWFTICLDGAVPLGEILPWINGSYELAAAT